jgi:hypothetical protein
MSEGNQGAGRSGLVSDVIVLGLALLLALVAVGLLAGSFLSYESVKARLDDFASDGDADVTRADFDAIVVRLRLAAAAAALLAGAVLAVRRRLAVLLAELGASTAAALSALGRGLASALTGEWWPHLAALGLVTAIAVAVRLEFLFQPMRYDESVTYVHYASRPWYIALTTYTAPNNHVLHSLLAHVSTAVLGDEPWAIRLPALLAGILLVPATYVAARALYGRHAALVAAGLVAGSSVLVEYSTNARGYTLVALLFVLSLALATRLRSSWSPAEWLAFAALGALGLATVPVMLYAFGAVALWLALELWRSDRRLLGRRLLPSLVTAGAFTALFYAPIVASSGLDAVVSNEFVESLSWGTFTDRLSDSLATVAEQWHRDVPLALALVLAACFAAGVVFHRRLSATAFPPALVTLAWIAPVVVVQRVVPFERVWLFLVPLYLATAAAGVLFALRPVAARAGGERVLAVALSAALALALTGAAVASQAVYESDDTSTFRDGEEVTALLEAELGPGDKVLVAPPADAILEYWLLRRGLDAAGLLYWDDPGTTRRFVVVVKEGPDDYPLEQVLDDPRLRGARLGPPQLLHGFDAASVYDVRRRR